MAQAGLALAEQIEHRQWITFGNWILGTLYLDMLVLPQARASLEHALALAHEVGSWNWIRIVSAFLAPVYLLQQDLAQADSILSAALEPDAAMQTIGHGSSAANLSDERVIPRLWKLRGESLAALHREKKPKRC